jgi:LCP family protein required for cell wall assembly
MAIATLLSIGLVVGSGLYWWKYRDFNNGLVRVVIGGGTGAQNTKPSRDIDGKEQNILIVGNDDRSGMTNREVKALHVGHDGGSLNTDVMMIIHVPANGQKATLISLPRDTYVDIPGYGKNKLNSAYVSGYNNAGGNERAKQAAGANLLITTIQDLTGLTIDHFVSIGFLGFYRISKAIDGIQVNMCNAVNDQRYSGMVLPKGKSTLSPVQTLQFVRQRHGLPLGDIDRTHRQQYFLTAAFRKVASAGGIMKLNSVLDAIKKSIIVDDNLDPLKLGQQMQALTANNIVSKTIPYVRFWDNSPVGSVVEIDPAQVKKFINDLVGTTDDALAKAKTIDPRMVSVEVYNAGSGIDHAATTAGDILRSQGLVVTKVEDAAAVDVTTIQYPAGKESQAKTLALYVPGATLVKSDVPTVRLLLGANGITAKALPVKPTGPGKPTTTPTGPTKPPTKPIDAKCIN